MSSQKTFSPDSKTARLIQLDAEISVLMRKHRAALRNLESVTARARQFLAA